MKFKSNDLEVILEMLVGKSDDNIPEDKILRVKFFYLALANVTLA